jgi:heme-degrading monooxygenase HmoA
MQGNANTAHALHVHNSLEKLRTLLRIERPPMVSEIAQISIKAGLEKDFEAGVAKAVPVFLRAKGCHGVRLERSIEHPSRYLLVVAWDTVEDHTVGFRSSEDFKEWRRLVGHCFENAPEVQHTHEIALRG